MISAGETQWVLKRFRYDVQYAFTKSPVILQVQRSTLFERLAADIWYLVQGTSYRYIKFNFQRNGMHKNMICIYQQN